MTATAGAAPKLDYAGFWRRVGAAVLDALIVGVPIGIVTSFIWPEAYVFQPETGPDGQPIMPNMPVGHSFLWVAVWVLYIGFLESGSGQASLGKRILGMKVTDLVGAPVGFVTAVWRGWIYWAGSLLAGLLGLIGLGETAGLFGLVVLISCVAVAFTPRRQGFHDMMADCLVIRSRAPG